MDPKVLKANKRERICELRRDALGLCFVHFCRKNSNNPRLAMFLNLLQRKLGTASACAVYSARSGNLILLSEGGDHAYWRVEWDGMNFLLPRPVSGECFEELDSIGMGCLEGDQIPKPARIGKCVPALLAAHGDDWEVVAVGDLSNGACPNPSALDRLLALISDPCPATGDSSTTQTLAKDDLHEVDQESLEEIQEGTPTGTEPAAQCKPYKFLGKNCATPAELAREAGQSKHWDEGIKHFQRRYIQDWVKQDVRDFDLLSKLQDIEDDKRLDWEQKLCVALLVLDPELPLCWRGETVTRDWIGVQATQDAKDLNKTLVLLTSSLPDWLERCRNQVWMLELRQRRQRLQTEVSHIGLNLARGDVDKMILLPFGAVQSEAQRRKETAYGAASETDEPLNILLKTAQWDEAKCIAVVACSSTRFLTREHRWTELRHVAEADAEGLVHGVNSLNNFSDFHAVEISLGELRASLERDFTFLSQPVPFERGDERFRKIIEEGFETCRQRVRSKRRSQKLTLAFALTFVTICGALGLHVWFLSKTSLSFVLSLDGKDTPVNKHFDVTIDGKSFAVGDNISLGKHELAIAFLGGEPFTRKVPVFYGKNDLGILQLQTSKGSLSITVNPSPATVNLQYGGKVIQQGDAPIKIDQLPVGDYSVRIRKREYEESRSIRINRGLHTDVHVDLNLGSAQLASDPPQAEFTLEGKGREWHGTLPSSVEDMPAGDYTLVVRRNAYQESHSLTINKLQNTITNIQLNLGGMQLSSFPVDAEFELTGNGTNWQGKFPMRIAEAPVGSYSITARRKGWETTMPLLVSRGIVMTNIVIFPYGSITVGSEPQGVALFLDGIAAGKTPTVIQEVKPGLHTLIAKDGQNEWKVDLEVEPNQTVNHHFACRFGIINLRSTPAGAEITWKGRIAGKTPMTIERIPAGETTMHLRIEGYVSTNLAILVREGATTSYSVKLTSERYITAVTDAQRAFDRDQMADAEKSIRLALSLQPNDPNASSILTNILTRIEASRQHRLREESRAAEEKDKALVEDLARLPLLDPINLVNDCWNVTHHEGGGANRAVAVPLEVGINVVLKPLDLLSRALGGKANQLKEVSNTLRFNMDPFNKNWQGKTVFYKGAIANVRTKDKTVEFERVGTHPKNVRVEVSLPQESDGRLRMLKKRETITIIGRVMELAAPETMSLGVNRIVIDDGKIAK